MLFVQNILLVFIFRRKSNLNFPIYGGCYCIKPLTNRVRVKESDGSPENRGKHLVVENTRGIHTDEVEHDSSSETQQNGRK